MNELLPLLNPIRDYSVEALRILQSIESIKKMVLKKEMFVPDAEKPDYPLASKYSKDDTDRYDKDIQEWGVRHKAFQAAQAKVLFAGFEKYGKDGVTNGVIAIWFRDNLVLIEHRNTTIMGATLLYDIDDLLHICKLYNRTAATKIELRWTENILKLLGNYIQSTPKRGGFLPYFWAGIVGVLLCFSSCNSFESNPTELLRLSFSEEILSSISFFDLTSISNSLLLLAIELDSHIRYKIAALLRAAIMILAAVHVFLIAFLIFLFLYGALDQLSFKRKRP